MRSNKKIGCVLLLLGVFMIFFILAFSFLRKIKEEQNTIQIYIKSPIEAETACQLIQENSQILGCEFLLWNRELFQTISFPDLGNKSIEVDVFAVCGKSCLLYESSVFLDTKDKNNCLLSDGAAYELFGTTDVKGLYIDFKGKPYCIIGSIPKEEPFMMYQIQETGEETLWMCTIKNSKGNNQEYMLEQSKMFIGEGVLVKGKITDIREAGFLESFLGKGEYTWMK